MQDTSISKPNSTDESISRRDFLDFMHRLGVGAAASSLIAGGCSKPSSPAPPASAPSGKRGIIIGAGQLHAGDQFALSIVDLDASPSKPRVTPLSFYAHGVSPNPTQPTKAALFEKQGKGACEVDLITGDVLRMIETAEDRKFYGHGDYSVDGSLLYSTETITNDDYEGRIAIRDAKTHEVTGDFPSFGSAPHDCRLIDGGKTMVITNGGGDVDGGPKPCVTYVDVGSQKLLEKLEFERPEINAGHLAVTGAGDLAVVSAPRAGMDKKKDLGALSLRRAGGDFQTLDAPREIIDRMIGESLSVCVHEPTGTVGVTNPLGNLLTFWNLRDNALLQHYELHGARGIALSLDDKFFVVSYGSVNPRLTFFSTDSLERASVADIASEMTGSHILTYNLDLST